MYNLSNLSLKRLFSSSAAVISVDRDKSSTGTRFIRASLSTIQGLLKDSPTVFKDYNLYEKI